MGLAVGLRATVRHVVTEADTAIRAGSGDVPVLATPRLLALPEAACVAALQSHLDAGVTSVGARRGSGSRRGRGQGAAVRGARGQVPRRGGGRGGRTPGPRTPGVERG